MIIFHIGSGGSGPVPIGISREGELILEDPITTEAIDYDTSMVEFGEEPSYLMDFIREWKDDPISTVIRYLLSSDTYAPLAADFAEHVLPIYESRVSYKHPRNAITALRKYLKKEMYHQTLMTHLHSVTPQWDIPVPAEWVARATQNAIYSIPIAGGSVSARKAAEQAVWAAAYNASMDNGSPEFLAAKATEKAWQMRRFLDCIEAIRSGKTWPPLSATE